jgi:hypothetical protein
VTSAIDPTPRVATDADDDGATVESSGTGDDVDEPAPSDAVAEDADGALGANGPVVGVGAI